MEQIQKNSAKVMPEDINAEERKESPHKEKPEMQIFAAVGGGGKTSLLFYLAEKYVREGKKVIVMTTTHMRYEENRPFALWDDRKKQEENIRDHGYTVTGILLEDKGKITCPSAFSQKTDPASLRRKFGGLCDLLLVEADGSKGLPLKVPAGHEPVIPPEADVVFTVVGLQALGKPISQICHRPQLVAALLHKNENELVTEEDVAAILCDDQNGLGRQIGSRPQIVILNQADDSRLQKAAEAIGGMIRRKKPQTGVCVTALKKCGGENPLILNI